MLDSSKLTPAPLVACKAGSLIEHPSGRVINTPAHVVRRFVDDQGRQCTDMVADFHRSDEDAEFYALARNEIADLLDALRNLHDMQNGPPSFKPRYVAIWTEAMAKAELMLEKWGA